jgi:hypothetical protein
MKKFLSFILAFSIPFSGFASENPINYELINRHCELLEEALIKGVIKFEEVDTDEIKKGIFMLGDRCEMRVEDYWRALETVALRGGAAGGVALTAAGAGSSNYIKLLTKGALVGIAPRFIPGIAAIAASLGAVSGVMETIRVLEEEQKKCLDDKNAEIIKMLDDHLKKLGHTR